MEDVRGAVTPGSADGSGPSGRRGRPYRPAAVARASCLRLGLALVLAQPCSGPCGRSPEGPRWAALAVTVRLAVSLIPNLLRVLSTLAKDAATNERDPNYAITVLGPILQVAAVVGFLVLLDIDQRL